MKLVNVYEARGQFSMLLDEAEAGEEIVIARNGTPVVRLGPVRAPQRRLGRWQGTVPQLTDEEWAASNDAVAELPWFLKPALRNRSRFERQESRSTSSAVCATTKRSSHLSS
jgi:prevent-host-death family protein